MNSRRIIVRGNEIQTSVPLTSKACGGAAVVLGVVALLLFALGR